MPFPPSPYLGQIFIDGGKLWRFNGLDWGIISLKFGHSPTPATPPSSELTLQALEARLTAIEDALNQSFLLID